MTIRQDLLKLKTVFEPRRLDSLQRLFLNHPDISGII
nr:MAG TPA: hypothetical protein [Caudoviricetes sp.]